MATTSEIRAWARTQGLDVGERGRLHPDILSKYELYEAAQETGPLAETYPEEDGPAAEQVVASAPKKRRPYVCGFCLYRSENQHLHCPTYINNGSHAAEPRVYCACAQADHVLSSISAE